MFYFMVVKFGMCVHVCIVAASRGGGRGAIAPPDDFWGKGKKEKRKEEKRKEGKRKGKKKERKRDRNKVNKYKSSVTG